MAVGESAELKALFSFKAEAPIPLYPSPEGLAFAAQTDGTPVLDTTVLPEPFDKPETWKGRTITVIVPTEELRGLVAYTQKLGTNRGAWREAFGPRSAVA